MDRREEARVTTSAGAKGQGARGLASGPALPLVGGVLLLVAWTSVMLPGFAFPWANNVFHLPIVLGYAASPEGPHDAFTQSLDNFVSAFWLLFRPFTTEANAFAVFFVAHLIGRIGFVAGIFAVTRTLGADRLAALALAGLAAIAPIFKGLSIIGHTETMATYLSHTGFAVAMLPLCWWLLLRGRWVAGACAIGLLFNVNAFISVWSVAAALAGFWAARGAIPDFRRRLVLCGLGYALCALPTIVWTLSTLAQPSHPIRFREYLLYYYPYHTFVHVQWLALARYAAFLAAAALALWTAARDLGPQGRVLAAIVAAYGAVFLFGVPLPYLTDSRLLLNLYPLRIDAVINVGVAAMTLAWAGKRWAEDRESLPLAVALALLTGNMIAALWLLFVHARRTGGGMRVGVVGASVGVVLVALVISPDLGDSFLPLLLIFAAASLCAAAASGAFAVIPAGLAFALSVAFVPGPLSLPSAAAIVLLSLVLALPKPALLRSSAALASTPAALLGGVLLIGLALSAHALHRGTVERPDADLGPDREAQLWLRSHTAPDTPFLPVGVTGFGLLSRRPAWVDAQAGAAVMWKPIYLDEWWPRIHAVNACRTEACFVDLARRNGVPWIVARADKFANVPGLSEQFTNARYRILRVEGVGEGRGEQ
jgi:hypothetical protein